MPLFGKIQVVEQQIDDFLDAVLQGALVYRDGIDDYDYLILLTKLDNNHPLLDKLRSITMDPESILTARNRLAEAVERSSTRRANPTVAD